MKKFITMLLVCATTLAMATTAFANDSQVVSSNYDFSVQEVVDEINEKYNVELTFTEMPQTRTTTSKLTREEFKNRLEKLACEAAKQSEDARAMFKERTGRDAFSEKNVETVALEEDAAVYATTKSYSKTKTFDDVAKVTLKGKVTTDSFTWFSSITSCTGGSVNNIINRFDVVDTDYELIDSNRTCAVIADVVMTYLDPQLGGSGSYHEDHYGEFYATE